MNQFSRTELLIGKEGIEKLANSRVAIFGIGGVGGYTVEALARSGVGEFDLIDDDRICLTNINRQILATRSTVGKYKVDVAMERILDINPSCSVVSLELFYGEDTWEQVFAQKPDYIIDCIDTVTAKLHLAVTCKEQQVPLLICLGTGNRLDPLSFRIGDIEETAKSGGGCGLARVMRRELKKRGITRQQVLYSTEQPAKTVISDGETGRNAPGSIAFCPPVAGYLLASRAVRELIRNPQK